MLGIFKRVKNSIIRGYSVVYDLSELPNKCSQILKIDKELLWRDIFIDTVKGYSWYHDKSLSLGRWAVGYNYAYVLARILDEFKPTSILECGLGQSSKIIADYVVSDHKVRYDIVEQDSNWWNFFKNNCYLMSA